MKIFKYSFLMLLAISIFSCEKDRAFTEYEDLEKGAYPRKLSGADGTYNGNFNYFDVANSSFTYEVEFYDENDGRNVTSYDWTVAYSGDASNRKPVKSFPASSFGSSERGYPYLKFTITFQEALDALGLTLNDIEGGNSFTFIGTVVLNDGRKFSSANSDGNVVGSAPFAALFQHRANIICPSDIGGEYIATTTGQSTDGCCPDPVTLTDIPVTLTALGGGQYEISDWSAGLYKAWYEVYGINDDFIAGGGMVETVSDVCGKFRGTFQEPFATTVTITGSIDEATGVITYSWKNGYDDAAEVTLTPK